MIGRLVPFVELEALDELPYIVASCLATFPESLHKNVVLLLCTNLLPNTLGEDDNLPWIDCSRLLMVSRLPRRE